MKFILLLASIIYLSLSNFYCLAKEAKSDEGILKVGLIVPLSGRHQEIGKSVLNSIRLALSKINNDQIEIFPKDNYSNPEKTLFAARQLEGEGIQMVIGPIFHQNLIYLGEVQNLTFLSLSNKTTTIPRNVITIGINANSQINAIVDFIKKENLNKTIVLVPKSNFENELRNALVKSKYEFMNIYSYDVKPDKLTSQIKQITAYDERKKKLEKIIEFAEKRIEILEKEEELKILKKKYTLGEVDLNSVVSTEKELKNLKKKYTLLDAQINEEELENLKKKYATSLDDRINKEELKNLKKKYTLGEVDFDSVIIANFGENLKSVTNSFSFSDVTAQDVKFITLNQWFDETLLKESSTNQIYFPSINFANYSKFKETYFKNYNKYPSQISILSYDILGLIYYMDKVQGSDLKKNIFNKKSYVGEVGKFSFEDKIIAHKLDIYQVFDDKFLKINK
ncbi:MAG: ABC transporter substrate-binding protein [Pelagibacteraceae bacterium]|nr:ABC transporter substrate-binding protein [Pelagibacteraceae bacterium]